MFKKNLIKFSFLGSLAIAAFASCKKEEVLAPAQTNNSGQMVIYIRAVDRDSTAVESEQILLR